VSWKLPLTTWATRLFSATKTQHISLWFSPQIQAFSKNKGFITCRMFTKNRIVILPKFLKSKNSLLGLNNQHKILLKKLRDVGLKIKEKNLSKTFLQFWFENTLNTLFPELFWDSVLKYFPKRNHFKVYVRLRLSQWHINKNLRK